MSVSFFCFDMYFFQASYITGYIFWKNSGLLEGYWPDSLIEEGTWTGSSPSGWPYEKIRPRWGGIKDSGENSASWSYGNTVVVPVYFTYVLPCLFHALLLQIQNSRAYIHNTDLRHASLFPLRMCSPNITRQTPAFSSLSVLLSTFWNLGTRVVCARLCVQALPANAALASSCALNGCRPGREQDCAPGGPALGMHPIVGLDTDYQSYAKSMKWFHTQSWCSCLMGFIYSNCFSSSFLCSYFRTPRWHEHLSWSCWGQEHEYSSVLHQPSFNNLY